MSYVRKCSVLTPRALAFSTLRSDILRCWTSSLTASLLTLLDCFLDSIFADVVGLLCRDAMLRRFALLIDLYSVVVFSLSLILRNILQHVSPTSEYKIISDTFSYIYIFGLEIMKYCGGYWSSWITNFSNTASFFQIDVSSRQVAIFHDLVMDGCLTLSISTTSILFVQTMDVCHLMINQISLCNKLFLFGITNESEFWGKRLMDCSSFWSLATAYTGQIFPRH